MPRCTATPFHVKEPLNTLIVLVLAALTDSETDTLPLRKHATAADEVLSEHALRRSLVDLS